MQCFFAALKSGVRYGQTHSKKMVDVQEDLNIFHNINESQVSNKK